MSKEVTIRGLIIGSLGSVVVTASSVYVALKLGALPWPTIFVAMLSMTILKFMGNTNIREINVTHTTMSAGAMVSGGLAFTLPAIWIIQPDRDFIFMEVLIVTLCGALLGLACTTLIRRYFIEIKKDEFTYPIGLAAYKTIKVSETTDKNTFYLFSAFGLSAIFTILRDKMGLIPPLFSFGKPNRTVFSAWVSPMAVAIGYIIGPVFSGIWALGALAGYFVLVPLGISTGLFDDETSANEFRNNLGIGLMVGTGIGVLVRGILPKIHELLGGLFNNRNSTSRWPILAAFIVVVLLGFGTSFRSLGVLAIAVILLIIIGTWFSATSSAVLAGQIGVNPLEVFGILVLLAVKFIIPGSTYLLVLSATVVAIASGLTGDMMNDYRVGYLVSTRPESQRWGETLGAIIGVVVSVSVIMLLFKNYGVDSLGKPEGFAAPQAHAVAAMAGQISQISALWIGVLVGFIFWLVKLPSMTLGLGVYLPVYITVPIFIGGLICLTESLFGGKKRVGTIAASGILGGEASIGVILAIFGLTQSIIP